MKLIRILSGPELLNFRLKRDCIAGFIVGTRQFDSLSPVVPSTGRDIVTSIPQRYESIAWNLFFFLLLLSSEGVPEAFRRCWINFRTWSIQFHPTLDVTMFMFWRVLPIKMSSP